MTAQVPMTPEARRVLGLPWRDWRAASAELVRAAEACLRLPGADPGMTLRAPQAAVLHDVATLGGCLAALDVGVGKTVPAALAASMVPAARDPVLLVPASLLPQALADHRRIGRTWRIRPDLRVRTYEELQGPGGEAVLRGAACVVADEAATLADVDRGGRTTARRGRFREHLEARARAGLGTVVVLLSATFLSRTAAVLWEALIWTVGQAMSPLPAGRYEAETWAAAIDPVPWRHGGYRVGPGALAGLMRHPHEPVAEAWGRRLAATPGVVVAHGDAGTNAALRIGRWDAPPPSPSLAEAVRHARDLWARPDGEMVAEATERWRLVGELSCGFWYAWEPPPPRAWLEARRAWTGWVGRELRLRAGPGYDTPGRVEAALQAAGPGSWPPEYRGWLAARDTYRYDTVPRWIDDGVARAAAAWALGGHGRCVLVPWDALGRRIAQHGLRYLGGGDADGRAVLDLRGEPVALSDAAHGTGRNLQPYRECLVPWPWSSARVWQQRLGRLHRSGQTAAAVRYLVHLPVPEARDALAAAIAESRWIGQAEQKPQKLALADLEDGLAQLARRYGS